MRHVGLFLLVCFLDACGGGSSGGVVTTPTSAPSPTPMPSAAPTVAPTATASPTGAASPTASVTPFAGGASLAAQFAANVPAAARSAVFGFTSNGNTVNVLASIPSGCGAASTCSVTVSAPVGANQAVQVLLYGSTNGSGTALAVGSQTATFFSGQATNASFALHGIMASFSVNLTPGTVTVGQASSIQTSETALDAAGETLAPGFVNSNLAAPTFSVSVSDPTNTSTTSTYSGLGAGPITYTVQTSGYASQTASLQFSLAASFHAGFAIATNVGLGVGCDLNVYPPQGSVPARTFSFRTEPNCLSLPRFDQNGVLWGVVPVGINPDGTSAGSFAPAAPQSLLTFDVTGKEYTTPVGINAINVYAGGALVRQINVSAAPIGATVDPSGNLYVGLSQAGVYEFGSAGTGSITPIAMNSAASGVPASDTAGDVFAAYGGGIGVWPAGTFGSGAPARVINAPSASLSLSSVDLAVDPTGGVYNLLSGVSQNALYYAAPGSTTFTVLSGAFEFSITGAQIATPLR